MRTRPVLSSLELSILGAVQQTARSGYAIRKALDSSPGAIYPALRRLAAAGFLEKRDGYHLTAEGRRALKSGLQGPAIQEVRRDPDGVAVRADLLTGSTASAFLTEYARLAAICEDEWKSQEGLAARYRAAMYAARARWASRTAASLKGR
ncbi:MAG TPA: PadR family transcriptional regulator [Thermoanaerobaculia bacterium]|nr:PadR family transcriptional regulator [Thermoanaerobaculia bacterium]